MIGKGRRRQRHARVFPVLVGFRWECRCCGWTGDRADVKGANDSARMHLTIHHGTA